MNNWVDRVSLLAAGLLALWPISSVLRVFTGTGTVELYQIAYLTAFGVFLIAGLLLLWKGFSILENRWVVVVAALIPVSLAAGLVAEFFPEYAAAFENAGHIGLLLLVITRFVGPRWLGTLTLVLVHGLSGLTIVGLPLVVQWQGRAPLLFGMMALGGALIGLGGIALAALRFRRPIMPERWIHAILSPLLLLTVACFVLGFVGKGV